MGLSICFNLAGTALGPDDAKRIVEELHAFTQAQGFGRVGPIFHETDADEHDDTFGALYPGRRVIGTARDRPPPAQDSAAPSPMPDEAIDAAAQEIIDLFDEKNARREMGLPDDDVPAFSAELIDATSGGWLDVKPIEAWFFWANAEGAEPFILGLARYPAVIEHEVDGEVELFETGLGVGWHWEGFCKTQYAGMPDAGGPDHFVATHRQIIAVLDRAVELGLLAEVHDEGTYWDERDEQKLRDKLHQYNALIASVAGRMKDADLDFESPILDHPRFEHLEADGEKAIKQFRQDAQRRHDKHDESD